MGCHKKDYHRWKLFSIRLPEDLKIILEKACKEQGTSKQAFIVGLIVARFAEELERNKIKEIEPSSERYDPNTRTGI